MEEEAENGDETASECEAAQPMSVPPQPAPALQPRHNHQMALSCLPSACLLKDKRALQARMHN